MSEQQDAPARQTASDVPSDTSRHDRSMSRPRFPKTKSGRKSVSAGTDEATIAFVRRTLCAHRLHSGTGIEGRSTPQPLEELLPPLTSSNDIDLQLYALVAIIIKDFVQAWYSKITPDHEFTDEVVQIIAHCTRGLEQRLRIVDLEALILDELPQVFEAHVTAYRTAYDGLHTSVLGTNPRELYHSINPHPALSPFPFGVDSSTSLEQSANESAWRQLLVQGTLALLLPPEDLESPPLMALVSNIFSELILGKGVCGSVCEGWFIYETVSKLLLLIRPSADEDVRSVEEPLLKPNRLEHFGLLNDESADRSADQEDQQPQYRNKLWDNFSTLFWQIVGTLGFVFYTMRFMVESLYDAAALPRRDLEPSKIGIAEQVDHDLSVQYDQIGQKTHQDKESRPEAKQPVLGMSIWRCCSYLFALDRRMPWLTETCALVQWISICGPGKVGCTDSRLDRFLSHYVHTYLLDPSRVPSLLRLTRTTLFPNNSLGPGRVLPSAEEALEIKTRCAQNIVDALPPFVRTKLFATQSMDVARLEVESMLEVFGDAYLNKHLVFSVVDLLFMRLFPEMERRSVSDLLQGASDEGDT